MESDDSKSFEFLCNSQSDFFSTFKWNNWLYCCCFFSFLNWVYCQLWWIMMWWSGIILCYHLADVVLYAYVMLNMYCKLYSLGWLPIPKSCRNGVGFLFLDHGKIFMLWQCAILIFLFLRFFLSDYLFKLLLIGDSGVGKSCLLLRFAVSSSMILNWLVKHTVHLFPLVSWVFCAKKMLL